MAEIRLDGLLRAILDTAEKNRRRNSPEAKAARSARSAKAAETRRVRLEELRKAEEWIEARIPDGPVCNAMSIVMDAQEVFCVRPPHRSGSHEDVDGTTWDVLEEEFEDMLNVTIADLRKLLDGPSDSPVLYVSRDEDTGEPVRLDVWDDAYVLYADVVARKHELVDALGGPDHPDGITDGALKNLLPLYQGTVDGIVGGEK
ncbi:hypothetical protein [Streptomyces sp. MH60]|uniref:hypothetical protein n=1 Tax=Streptomyces sp. MH60 TaxID=1940758 RepID=UPI000CEEF893|nr:hypothetical protein [Streptomyces sp. MH60]PPS89420.1 hypothetical protein BZZ08_01566 [Streptomyces sp. MH60]